MFHSHRKKQPRTITANHLRVPLAMAVNRLPVGSSQGCSQARVKPASLWVFIVSWIPPFKSLCRVHKNGIDPGIQFVPPGPRQVDLHTHPGKLGCQQKPIRIFDPLCDGFEQEQTNLRVQFPLKEPSTAHRVRHKAEARHAQPPARGMRRTVFGADLRRRSAGSDGARFGGGLRRLIQGLFWPRTPAVIVNR